jgi:hypothetical protein
MDTEFHTLGSQFPACPIEELVRECVLKTVFSVNPGGVSVVHPVNEDVVNFSLKSLRESFGAGKQRGYHGIGRNTGPVQTVESGESVRDRRCLGLKELSDVIVQCRDREPHFGVARGFEDAQVPENEGGTRLHDDGPVGLRQYLQTTPRKPVFLLKGLDGSHTPLTQTLPFVFFLPTSMRNTSGAFILTSTKSPQGSLCPVNLFMKRA